MIPADLFCASATIAVSAQRIILQLTESSGFFLSRWNPIPADHPALRYLALQHAIRHYCGSDDMRAAEQAQGRISLNQKHMRNAVL